MISAADAIERLREGNRRFATETRNADRSAGRAERVALLTGQAPFAAILSCADSRVPVELVFDQGLGDLFVVRVAGNVVAPTQLGSIEFAATQLGTRLVVVLGHSNCGAVDAALQGLRQEQAHPSPNLRAILDRIQPAVEPLLQQDEATSLHDAVVANVHRSVERLRQDSTILDDLVDSGDLTIIGAEYSMETGRVTFLEAP